QREGRDEAVLVEVRKAAAGGRDRAGGDREVVRNESAEGGCSGVAEVAAIFSVDQRVGIVRCAIARLIDGREALVMDSVGVQGEVAGLRIGEVAGGDPIGCVGCAEAAAGNAWTERVDGNGAAIDRRRSAVASD